MNPIVYICHHVDTEGPLYETVEASFKRLEVSVLGGGGKFPIEYTKANLTLLQQGKVDFLTEEQRQKAMIMAHPHLLQTKSTWSEIDEMQYRIMSPEYRNKFQDSFGCGWVYNWHVIDFVGYEINPRHRDMGWHNIYDHYTTLLKETKSDDIDAIEWHFHPMHHKHVANLDSNSYDNSMPLIHQALSRKLIDRGFFPRVFRPGCHCERPDTCWFLEQWIPFDVANQSVKDDDYIGNGRFGDWNGAPSDWSIYHPDLYDWRKEGQTNRWVARVMNLKTRFRNVTQDEVDAAFEKASRENCPVYLGVTDHDWREISNEIEPFYEMILKANEKYPMVKFKFSKGIDAFREVLGLPQSKGLDFETTIEGNLLSVKFTQGEPFGPQPYLAIKTKEGEYFHENFDFGEFKKSYYFTFDDNTVKLNDIETLVIATNDSCGNQCIKRIINNI
jgi:hypothetical protein